LNPGSGSRGGFLGERHVAFWTVLGGMAAVLGIILTIFLVTKGNGPTSIPSSSKSATATATPTASGGGSGANGNGGAPAIYHQGQLTLAYATCVDLDAPPSDRQWGEVSIGASSGGFDLCSQSPEFVGTGGATIVTVNSGTDTTCQNATGWLRQNYYQDLNLSVGSFVCVHTNQGRYSLLRVEAIDSTANAIMFRVKTFKKPGD
jgi:hypothetical protein